MEAFGEEFQILNYTFRSSNDTNMSRQKAVNTQLLTPPDTPASGLRGTTKFQAQSNTPRAVQTIRGTSPPITPEPNPVESFASREEDNNLNDQEPREPQAPVTQDSTFFQEPTPQKNKPSRVANSLDESNTSDLKLKQTLLRLLANFINLARKTSGRPSEAQIQRALDLIEDVRYKRYRGDKCPQVTLSAAEYRELRRCILKSNLRGLGGYFEHELRYEYKRIKKQFQIRMPTTVHESVVGLVQEKWAVWKSSLMNSKDLSQEITSAAGAMWSLGSANIKMDQALGEADTASPDWSCFHRKCTHKCKSASIVFEVAWTQTTRELHARAERYISASSSQVRTVVGLNLHDMYLAELRNQKRKYSDEQEITTGEAKFAVWRRVIGLGSRKSAELVVPEQTFRDNHGSALPQVALNVSFKDFVCGGSTSKTLEDSAIEPLVISSEELCEYINDGLELYRAEKKEQLESEQREENPRTKKSSRIITKEKGRGEKKAKSEPGSRISTRRLLGLFTGRDGRRQSSRLSQQL
ncbi:hypothetical protein GGR53DRAFT_510092 [Hypoxylon sp. FL1150]|nr:hypothetical protein GGR53DRAFT_510092 [Hypoxylon sp. FL1150]